MNVVLARSADGFHFGTCLEPVPEHLWESICFFSDIPRGSKGDQERKVWLGQLMEFIQSGKYTPEKVANTVQDDSQKSADQGETEDSPQSNVPERSAIHPSLVKRQPWKPHAVPTPK